METEMREKTDEEKEEVEAMAQIKQALAGVPFERIPGFRVYRSDAKEWKAAAERLAALKKNSRHEKPEDESE
jgi:hypothetical protein